MASPPLGPVALNATPLLTPLTGIGRYTRHLAIELAALLDEKPWLFYAREWSRDVREAPAPSPQDAAAQLKGRIPFAYEMARWLQQRHFQRGAHARRIALYHEPNYLAFRFDGPTVVTIHDLSWVRHPETHPAERVRAMERGLPKVIARAAHLVTDSEFVRGEIIEHYGVDPARVSAVPLGVDPEFQPVPREACAAALATLGLEYGRYCLALGTLEPRKNISSVMDAHASLPEPLRRRFPLMVVGMKGWGEGVHPRHREAERRGEMRLLGYVPHEVLPPLYSGARLLAYPSLYEGFGLPPLEAMACGTPVIASRRASLPEVVGDAGMLVEPRDVEVIRDSLRALMEDDVLHARLGAAGRARSTGFTWRRCGEGTVAAYRRATAERTAPIGS